MFMAKKLLPIILLGLLAGGCSTTITNLTPKQEARNANGFYLVEVALNTTQQTLRWNSIKPNVVVGKEFYTMKNTALMTNRWETLVPIPPGASSIDYRFKFDYKYNVFSAQPQPDSKLSRTYRLTIMDGDGR
jgi:hypothetical protein